MTEFLKVPIHEHTIYKHWSELVFTIFMQFSNTISVEFNYISLFYLKRQHCNIRLRNIDIPDSVMHVVIRIIQGNLNICLKTKFNFTFSYGRSDICAINVTWGQIYKVCKCFADKGLISGRWFRHLVLFCGSYNMCSKSKHVFIYIIDTHCKCMRPHISWTYLSHV